MLCKIHFSSSAHKGGFRSFCGWLITTDEHLSITKGSVHVSRHRVLEWVPKLWCLGLQRESESMEMQPGTYLQDTGTVPPIWNGLHLPNRRSFASFISFFTKCFFFFSFLVRDLMLCEQKKDQFFKRPSNLIFYLARVGKNKSEKMYLYFSYFSSSI